MNTELLADHGIDWEKGLQNCIGDVSLYKQVLTLFLEDNNYSHAKEAYEKKDLDTLLARVHELKGISGNLALIRLFEASDLLVKALRRKDKASDIVEIDQLYSTFERAYNKACEGVKLLLNQ